MAGEPAARHGDPLAETNEAEGGLIGLAVGVGLAALTVLLLPAAPALLVVGAVLAGAGGGALAGMHIGEASEDDDADKRIESGSPDTLIEDRWAARAGVDTVTEDEVPRGPDEDEAPPGDNPLVAQGSATVAVNRMPLARRHEKDEDGSAVKEGARRTLIGGPSAQVVKPGEDLGEVPRPVKMVANVAMWGGLALMTGGSAMALMANGMRLGPALGSAVAGNAIPLGVGMGTGWAGGEIARALGADEVTARSVEVGAGFVGGGLSASPANRMALRTFAPKAPPGTHPSGNDPLAPKKKLVENREDVGDYIAAHRDRIERVAGELDAQFPDQLGARPAFRRAAAQGHDAAKVTDDPALTAAIGEGGKRVSDKLVENFGKEAKQPPWMNEMNRYDAAQERAVMDRFEKQGVSRAEVERGDKAIHVADRIDRFGDPVSRHAEFGRILKPSKQFAERALEKADAAQRKELELEIAVADAVEGNYTRVVPDRLLYINRKLEVQRQRAIAQRFADAQRDPRVLMEVFGWSKTTPETAARLAKRREVSHAEQLSWFAEGNDAALARFNEMLARGEPPPARPLREILGERLGGGPMAGSRRAQRGAIGDLSETPVRRDLIPEDWNAPPPMNPSNARLSPEMQALLDKVQVEQSVEIPRGVDKSGLLEHLNQQSVEYGLFRELATDGKPGKLVLTRGYEAESRLPGFDRFRLVYHNHPGGNWRVSQGGGDLGLVQARNPRQRSTAIGTKEGIFRQKTPQGPLFEPNGRPKAFDPDSLLLRRIPPEQLARRAEAERAIAQLEREMAEDAARAAEKGSHEPSSASAQPPPGFSQIQTVQFGHVRNEPLVLTSPGSGRWLGRGSYNRARLTDDDAWVVKKPLAIRSDMFGRFVTTAAERVQAAKRTLAAMTRLRARQDELGAPIFRTPGQEPALPFRVEIPEVKAAPAVQKPTGLKEHPDLLLVERAKGQKQWELVRDWRTEEMERHGTQLGTDWIRRIENGLEEIREEVVSRTRQIGGWEMKVDANPANFRYRRDPDGTIVVEWFDPFYPQPEVLAANDRTPIRRRIGDDVPRDRDAGSGPIPTGWNTLGDTSLAPHVKSPATHPTTLPTRAQLAPREVKLGDYRRTPGEHLIESSSRNDG